MLLFLVDEDGVMAGLKGSMAGFMLVVVCLAVVPSVNGKPCALFPAEDVIESNLVSNPCFRLCCRCVYIPISVLPRALSPGPVRLS